jgi:hypothetical protein
VIAVIWRSENKKSKIQKQNPEAKSRSKIQKQNPEAKSRSKIQKQNPSHPSGGFFYWSQQS